MKNLWLDVRYALRQLRSSLGFALTAVLALALGIAACSTIFSWIDSTLLNPIPGVAHTSRMVIVQRGRRSAEEPPPLSYPDYADLRDATSTLSSLVAYHEDFMTITALRIE